MFRVETKKKKGPLLRYVAAIWADVQADMVMLRPCSLPEAHLVNVTEASVGSIRLFPALPFWIGTSALLALSLSLSRSLV